MAIFLVTLVHTGIAGPLVWVGGGGGSGYKKIGGGSLIGTKKIGFGRAAADFFGIWGSEHDSECDFRNSQNQEKHPKSRSYQCGWGVGGWVWVQKNRGMVPIKQKNSHLCAHTMPCTM